MEDCPVKLHGEEQKHKNAELLESNTAHVNVNC
jgi:hypothetical protein